MSIDQVKAKLAEGLDRLADVDAVVLFQLDDGRILLDATVSPAVISDADMPADCTIKMSSADLLKMIEGKLNPMLAYTMGKLKVAGSTGVAMKLASALEG